MKIKLTEVGKDGNHYVWDQTTGEANSVLADLIGKNAYKAEFFIKPLNSRDFELLGKVRTSTMEICSRCASEINLPLEAKFHEILIPKQDQPRTAKYSKVNHVSDMPQGGPEVSEYENMSFDMGEFLHEVVGLAVPFNPLCPPTVDGKPSECQKLQTDQPFKYDEEMPTEKPQNPFSSLKNLKLN